MDWSILGLEAILIEQDNEGPKYVIAYASRNNNKVEPNYSSYEGKALADV